MTLVNPPPGPPFAVGTILQPACENDYEAEGTFESYKCTETNQVGQWSGKPKCSSCKPGTLAGNGCHLCPRGFYCPNPLDAAILCNDTVWCGEEGLNATQPCPSGSFCFNSTAKQACDVGEYCPGNVFGTNSTLRLCPAGYRCPSANISLPCDPGYLCTPGSSTQRNCTSGYYCSPSTPGIQTKCDSGKWCPEGSSGQLDCEGGMRCDKPGAPTQCEEGYFCVKGSPKQLDCPAGSYCPAGTAELDGKKCGAGHFNPNIRSISEEACLECDSGFSTANLTGATGCTECVAPTYSNAMGSPLCTPCGTKTRWKDSQNCDDCTTEGCNGGAECNFGYTGDLCSACLNGYYLTPVGLNDLECHKCTSDLSWQIPILIVLAVMAAMVFFKLNSSIVIRQAVVPLAIGINYFQVIAFLNVADLSWPSAVKGGFTITKPLVLDLGMWTQCFIPFTAQFWVVMVSPLLILLPLALAWYTFARIQQRKAQPEQKQGGAAGEASQAVQDETQIKSVAIGVGPVVSEEVVDKVAPVVDAPASTLSRFDRVVLRVFQAFDVRTLDECSLLVKQSMLSFLSFVYITLTAHVLMPFDLQRNDDGDLYLRADARIRYRSGEWYGLIPGVVIGSAVWVIMIPLGLHLLTRHKQAAFYLNSLVNTLHVSRYWWVTFELLWRLAMALVMFAISIAPIAQVVLCAALLGLRCAMVLYHRPYDSPLQNREETRLALITIFIVFCGLIFFFANANHKMNYSAAAFVVTLVYLAMVAMLAVVAHAVFVTWRRGRAAQTYLQQTHELKTAGLASAPELGQMSTGSLRDLLTQRRISLAHMRDETRPSFSVAVFPGTQLQLSSGMHDSVDKPPMASATAVLTEHRNHDQAETITMPLTLAEQARLLQEGSEVHTFSQTETAQLFAPITIIPSVTAVHKSYAVPSGRSDRSASAIELPTSRLPASVAPTLARPASTGSLEPVAENEADPPQQMISAIMPTTSLNSED